jgi:hypothetical protein
LSARSSEADADVFRFGAIAAAVTSRSASCCADQSRLVMTL